MKTKVLFITLFLFYLICLNASAEELEIVGTGSGPLILKSIGKAFMEENPDIKISVPRSIGSGGGIKAIGSNRNQLGRVARQIKQSEQHYNLEYVPIAHMPVIFFTHNNIKIENLTKEQVVKIYSGEVYNWSEVGGPDKRIKVVRRQDGESTLGFLRREFPGFKNLKITPLSKITYSDPDNIDLIESTSDTIAFGTYSDVLTRNVNVLAIDDVHPSEKDYPYFTTFGLVYKDENNTGVVKKFLEYATSSSAEGPILNSGGLPVR